MTENNLTDGSWDAMLARLQKDAAFNDAFVCPRHEGLPTPCRVDQYDKTRTPMVQSPSGRAVVCPLLENETCAPSVVWRERANDQHNALLEAQGKALGLPESLLDASFANAQEDWTFVQKGHEIVRSGALESGRLVCLLGNFQTGKSYVAACLLRRLGQRGRFEFFPTLSLRLTDSAERRKTIETLIDYPALVLDNVMWTAGTRVAEQVETLCLARLQHKRPTIITSVWDWDALSKTLNTALTSQVRDSDIYEVSTRTSS